MTVNYTTRDQHTTQEVFDHIVRHLLRQKKVATVPCISRDITICTGVTVKTSPTSCTMLSADGLQCAAGCLFTPEQIKQIVQDESFNLDLEEEWFPWRNKLNLTDKHDAIIEAMQDIHDEAEHIDNKDLITHWKEEFTDLAHHLMLNTDVINDTYP